MIVLLGEVLWVLGMVLALVFAGRLLYGLFGEIREVLRDGRDIAAGSKRGGAQRASIPVEPDEPFEWLPAWRFPAKD